MILTLHILLEMNTFFTFFPISAIILESHGHTYFVLLVILKNIAIMISQKKLLDTVKSEHKNQNEFRQEVSDDFQP